MKNLFICYLPVFIILSTLLLSSCNENPSPPNVILIMTDDQGYGDLACHGNPIVKTPQLDKLYEESIRFIDFHVNSFCAPTRAALLTGRMSDRTHVWSTVYARNHLNKEETTMAEFFKASGYKTGHFGKWHLGNNYPYRPMDRGFDRWVGQGGGTGSASDYWANDRLNDHYLCDGEWKKIEGFGTDIFFDETMEFIKESGERPFFVYLATYAPHGPMNVLKEWREQYSRLGKPPGSRPWGDTWDLFATLTRFDYNVGRLRDFLEENDLDKNTLIIYTTDNGTSDGHVVFNAGMNGRKGSSYEGGHRVPLFMHWPAGGLNQKKDLNQFIWHFDLLPTLIDLCDLKIPEKGHLELDGKSLVPLLKEQKITWADRTVFMHTQNTQDELVKGRSSLIATSKWRLINGKNLYNILTDPRQEHNVAGENPAVITDLLRQYDHYWEELQLDNIPYSRPVIGTVHLETTFLSPEDWVRDKGVHTWNQRHVADGVNNNGFWPIHISQPGMYQFEVRRWPEELDHPIKSGLPEYIDQGITTLGEPVRMDEGKAISVQKIRIQVGAQEMEKNIDPDQTKVVFEMKLEPGDKNIRTWMVDDEGNEQGAYYVYAKKQLKE